MKLLTHTQTQIISGAANGDYYFEGVSHLFECPAVSQVCLNSVLSFADKTNPALNIPQADFNDAINNCEGFGNFRAAGACMDPIVSEIRVAAGLPPR